MKKILKIGLLLFVIYLFGTCEGPNSIKLQNPNPEIDGYVNSPETAIKIAEAVWLPIYGEIIYSSKPFEAELKDSIWVVSGTVHAKLGGAPYAEISKMDGRILKVTHYK